MSGGNFTGDDDSFFFHTKNDTDNPGSVIWTGEGNSLGGGTSVDGLICFSGVATVQVLGREKPKPLADLVKGDRVLTSENQYEAVYSFAHQNRMRQAQFLTIYTADSKSPLEISKEHLVFLDGYDSPVRADSVKVGDNLRGQRAPKRVTKIGAVQRQGFYAPLTSSGTVVVDGVLASTYAAIVREEVSWSQSRGLLSEILQQYSHSYIHNGMSPFRLYCGLSENLCSSYNDDGMPQFVAFGIWISNLASQQLLSFQILYLAGFVIATGACTLLEKVVLSHFGFLALAALYLIRYHTSLRTFKKKEAKSI